MPVLRPTARRLVLAVIGLSGLAGPGVAPAQGRPVRSDSVARALATIRPGSRLRLDLGTVWVSGRLGLVSRDSVEIRNGMARSVGLAAISGIEIRGRATWIGAAVGGAAGVGFGILYAVALANVCEGCNATEVYLVVPALVGASGALAGGLIGSVIPRWKRRYP